MGGVVSCIDGDGSYATLLHWDGSFNCRVRIRVDAGELLELLFAAPGTKIASLNHIRRTGRVYPLGTYELLIPGRTYVLVPLENVGERVDKAHMAVLDEGCAQLKWRAAELHGSSSNQVSSFPQA